MISIIIPAYNSANYLKRCLDSIIAQTEDNYEVLVIDDGSTDETPEVSAEYAAKTSKIIPIRKENGGVSSARNMGLKKAKGDFIIFVDCDDYLSNNALEIIAADVKNNPGKDVFIYNNLIKLNDGISMCPNTQNFESMEQLIFETIERLSNTENEWLRTIWSKVYRKKVLDDVEFPKNVYIGQDACFFVTLLNSIKDLSKIYFSNDAWYIYDRTNELSATHSYKKDLFLLSCLQLDYLSKETANLKNYDLKYKNSVFAKFCWNLFWVMYYQGQNIKGNYNCFKWFDYTYDNYLNTNELYKLKFNNKLMDISFSLRKFLHYKFVHKVLCAIYIKKNIKTINENAKIEM